MLELVPLLLAARLTHVALRSEFRFFEVDKNLFKVPEDYKKLTFTELRKRLTPALNNPETGKGIH